MKTYAILRNSLKSEGKWTAPLLIKLTENKEEAEKAEKKDGFEVVTVVLKTETEKKLLNALSILVKSTVRSSVGNGWELMKVNRTGQGDGEVMDNAKSALNDVIGMKVL